MGGLHLKIQKLKHRDNAEQTLAESKVKSSRPYSSQNVPRSFRSTRGRVAGQHAHGFLMRSRLVEIEQNALYNKGTQKEKTGKRRSRSARKRRVLYTLANIYLHYDNAEMSEKYVRSWGRRGTSSRRITGCTTDRICTHTAIIWRLEKASAL